MSKEFLLRLISGLGLTAFVTTLVFLAPPFVFTGLMVILVGIGTYEFVQGLKIKGIEMPLWQLGLSLGTILTGFYFYGWKGLFLSVFVLSTSYLILFKILKNKRLRQTSLFNAAYVTTIPLAGASCSLIRQLQTQESPLLGASLIFFLGLTIAFTDTWAYFGGKSFGKTLLAPVLSPKKTWEGSLCGALAAMIGSVTYSAIIDLFPSYIEPMLIILGITILSQLGDLVESAFKRFCGIKDSGNLIPGHGGLMDRMDGFLLAAPFFFLYLILAHPEWYPGQ